MVEVHQMHNKDHSLLEFNLNIELDGLAASAKNNPLTTALVPHLPHQQNPKPHPALVADHNLYSHHKAAGHQNITVYTNWLQSHLRLL